MIGIAIILSLSAFESLREIADKNFFSPRREGACAPRNAGEPVRRAAELTINHQLSVFTHDLH